MQRLLRPLLWAYALAWVATFGTGAAFLLGSRPYARQVLLHRQMAGIIREAGRLVDRGEGIKAQMDIERAYGRAPAYVARMAIDTLRIKLLQLPRVRRLLDNHYHQVRLEDLGTKDAQAYLRYVVLTKPPAQAAAALDAMVVDGRRIPDRFYEWRARVALSTGDFVQAGRCFSNAGLNRSSARHTAPLPTNASSLRHSLYCLLWDGQFSEAASRARIRLPRNDPDRMFFEAVSLDVAGRTNDAAGMYRLVLHACPSHHLARLRLVALEGHVPGMGGMGELAP